MMSEIKETAIEEGSELSADNRRSSGRRKAVLKVAFFVVLGLTAFAYAIVFVYFINRPFIHGKDSTCQITRAERFCWRRELFSISLIESGSYTCWLFRVLDTTGTSLLAQYRFSNRLPDITNLCNSFEECGGYSMQCRLNTNGDQVILKWRFPTFKFIMALLLSAFAFATAAWHCFRMFRSKRLERCIVEDITTPPRSVRRVHSYKEEIDLWLAEDVRRSR